MVSLYIISSLDIFVESWVLFYFKCDIYFLCLWGCSTDWLDLINNDIDLHCPPLPHSSSYWTQSCHQGQKNKNKMLCPLCAFVWLCSVKLRLYTVCTKCHHTGTSVISKSFTLNDRTVTFGIMGLWATESSNVKLFELSRTGFLKINVHF